MQLNTTSLGDVLERSLPRDNRRVPPRQDGPPDDGAAPSPLPAMVRGLLLGRQAQVQQVEVAGGQVMLKIFTWRPSSSLVIQGDHTLSMFYKGQAIRDKI